MSQNNKVVLAYSGGLDTSYCVKYLQEEKGLEVYGLTVDTGGFSNTELDEIKKRAYDLGVKDYKSVNIVESYYNQCIKFLIFGNILKNNTYPLSVSAERVFQAIAVAEYAKEIDAAYVAHGSTGAGNDQVRFDMIFNIIIPNAKIITPIRDNQLSRQEEVEYLQSHGVEFDAQKAIYSINQGIWGTSVGGKETLTSRNNLPEEAFPSQLKSKADEVEISLVFEKGELIGINDENFNHPTQAIIYLNNIAKDFAIGRDIHVGDTIIGIKGRVGFEAAAPIVIIKAHHLLEKHVLSKQQLFWKDIITQPYSQYIHEGLFFEPVMRDIEAFLSNSQKNVTGKVFVKFKPYQFELVGIESKFDLMSSKFGSYGEMNRSWTGEDVRGFSKIYSNQMMIHKKITDENR